MPRVTTDRLKALAHGLGVPAEDLFACALSKTPPAAANVPYRIDLINAAWARSGSQTQPWQRRRA